MSNYDPRRGGGDEYRPAASAPTSRPAPSYDAAPPWPVHNVPMPAEAPGPVDPDVVVFLRAYPAHDLQVKQVRFRKPTPGDLRKCGYPLRNCVTPGVGVTGIEELPDVIGKYITLLSDPPLPPSTVNGMELEDFSKCSSVVLGFFL